MLQTGIDMIATGRNIDRLLETRNISVFELTKIMGLATTNAVYKWLRGETLPNLDNLVFLSRVLGTPIDEIIIVKASEDNE